LITPRTIYLRSHHNWRF